MGALLVPGLILGGVMDVAGDAMSGAARNREAAEQEQAIQLQEARAKGQAAAAGISRAQQEQRILSTQKAMAAAQGMSEQSGTFGSLVAGSEAAYAQDNKMANLSLTMSMDNMDAQMKNIREKQTASNWMTGFDIFKDVGTAGIDTYEAAGGGWGREINKDNPAAGSADQDIYDFMSDSGSWI